MRCRRHRDKRKRKLPATRAVRLALACLVLAALPAAAQIIPGQYPSTTVSYAASGVITAGPAFLNGCLFYSKNASTVYLQFFNSTTVPSDGTAPAITSISIASNTNGAWDAGASGARYFSTGLSWAASSTINTKTVIGSTDVLLSCQYNGNR